MLDPLQSLDLIQQSIIAGYAKRRLFAQLGMRQPAEDTQPIVDGDDDDALARRVVVPSYKASLLDPVVSAPPCIQKKTGALRAPVGAQIFSVRQSSLIGTGVQV